jgi:hypothetical protein
MRPKAIRAAILFLAVGTVWACDDPYKARADQTNVNQFFAVSAITGTPTNAPVALNLTNKAITRLDGAFDFDIAFDLDAQGKAILLPIGLVGTPVGGAHLVGLQRASGVFDSVTQAPKKGYVFDSTFVAAPGAVFTVQSQVTFCAASLTPYIFAKLVIDSVNVPQRTLYGRTLINLNCGFRSLATGTPTF